MASIASRTPVGRPSGRPIALKADLQVIPARLLLALLLLLHSLSLALAAAPPASRIAGFAGLSDAEQRAVLSELYNGGRRAQLRPEAQALLQGLVLQPVLQQSRQLAELCLYDRWFSLGDETRLRAAFGNTTGGDRNMVLLQAAGTNAGHIDDGPYNLPLDQAIALRGAGADETWWHEVNHTLLADAAVGIQQPLCDQLRINDREAVTVANYGTGCRDVPGDQDPPGAIGFQHPIIRGVGQLGNLAYDRLRGFENKARAADREEDELLAHYELLDPDRLRQIWSPAHQAFSTFIENWRLTLQSEITVGAQHFDPLPAPLLQDYRRTTGIFFSPSDEVALAYQAGCLKGGVEPTGEPRGIYPPKWVFEPELPLMPTRVDLTTEPRKVVAGRQEQRFTFKIVPKASWITARRLNLGAGQMALGLQRGLLSVELQGDADPEVEIRLERKAAKAPDTAYRKVPAKLPNLFNLKLDPENHFRLAFSHRNPGKLNEATSYTIRIHYEDLTLPAAADPKREEKVYDAAEALLFIDFAPAPGSGPTATASPTSPGGDLPVPPQAPPPAATQPATPPPKPPVTLKQAERILKLRPDFFANPGYWASSTPLANLPNLRLPKAEFEVLVGVNGIDGVIDSQAPEWAELQRLLQQIANPGQYVQQQMQAHYKQMGLDPALMQKATAAVMPFVQQFTQTYPLLDSGYQRVGRPVEIWGWLEPPTLPSVPFPYQATDPRGQPITRNLQARFEVEGWEFVPNVAAGRTLGQQGGIAGWTAPAGPADPLSAATPTDLYLDLRIHYRITLHDPATGAPYREGGVPLEWGGQTRNFQLGMVYYPIGEAAPEVRIEQEDQPLPPPYEEEEEPPPLVPPDPPPPGTPRARSWKTVTLPPFSYQVPLRTVETWENAGGGAPARVDSCLHDIGDCLFGFGVATGHDGDDWLPLTTDRAATAPTVEILGQRADHYRIDRDGEGWELLLFQRGVLHRKSGEQRRLAAFWRTRAPYQNHYAGLLERIRDTLRLQPIAQGADDLPDAEFEFLAPPTPSDAPVTATALRREAADLQARGDYPGALDRYRRSLELEPDPRIEERVRKLEAYLGVGR